MKDASHNAQDGYTDLREIATPGSPAAGWLRRYAKTDDKLYTKTSAGVEAVVGGASTFAAITDGELLARLNLAILR